MHSRRGSPVLAMTGKEAEICQSHHYNKKKTEKPQLQ